MNQINEYLNYLQEDEDSLSSIEQNAKDELKLLKKQKYPRAKDYEFINDTWTYSDEQIKKILNTNPKLWNELIEETKQCVKENIVMDSTYSDGDLLKIIRKMFYYRVKQNTWFKVKGSPIRCRKLEISIKALDINPSVLIYIDTEKNKLVDGYVFVINKKPTAGQKRIFLGNYKPDQLSIMWKNIYESNQKLWEELRKEGLKCYREKVDIYWHSIGPVCYDSLYEFIDKENEKFERKGNSLRCSREWLRVSKDVNCDCLIYYDTKKQVLESGYVLVTTNAKLNKYRYTLKACKHK